MRLLRDYEINADIVWFNREFGDDLKIKADADFAGMRRQRSEQAVVVSATPPAASTSPSKCDAWDQNEIHIGGQDQPRWISDGFSEIPLARLQFVERFDGKERKTVGLHTRIANDFAHRILPQQFDIRLSLLRREERNSAGVAPLWKRGDGCADARTFSPTLVGRQ